MNNKLKKFINFVTIINVIIFSSQSVLGQDCRIVPTCESLGYSQSAVDCKEGEMLKCPFDTNKVFCKSKCKSSNIGDILYSDFTCSQDYNSAKTPIGIIFHPQRRLAIALGTQQMYYNIYYPPNGISTPYINTITSNFDGKQRTKKIYISCVQEGLTCDISNYVLSYTTKGTTAGDWYLPAPGELEYIYLKKDILNSSLSLVNGARLPSGPHLSSYITDEKKIEVLDFEYKTWNQLSAFYSQKDQAYVRPVIEF